MGLENDLFEANGSKNYAKLGFFLMFNYFKWLDFESQI
jgi:hypothetical protein